MLKRLIEGATTADPSTAWSGNVLWMYLPPMVGLGFVAYMLLILLR